MATRTIPVRLTPIGPEPPRIRTEDEGADEPLVREVVTRRLVLDGPAVRRRRGALGCSLREVARRIGVSSSYLSDIEHGHRQPSAAVRERLLAALDAMTARRQ